MRSVIGVIPLYDVEKESILMLPGYIKILERCGAIPIILPLTDNKDELDYFNKLCDGFLLTGGHDVNPKIYGEDKHEKCGDVCDIRDSMEGIVLKAAVDNNKSVFGICRGIQFMNAFYGGSLYQDLESEYDKMTAEHHMSPPYDRPIHKVKVYKDTPLYDAINLEEYEVNSYHHQAVKYLSPHFKVMAESEDGLIEGIYMPDKKFVLGVQWHPEFIYLKDEASVKLIQAFVDSCKNK